MERRANFEPANTQQSNANLFRDRSGTAKLRTDPVERQDCNRGSLNRGR
jgi:hypothetical protein